VKEFDRRSVIITGGTKGIGRGIALRFLEAGADVVVCARNAPDAPVVADGREAVFVQANVRDVDSIESVVKVAIERFGRLDVLVNNAGGSPPVDAATVSPRFSASIIDLNLTAPLYFAQAANRAMQSQDDGGSIINIASVSGLRPSPGTAAYGAAKAGLLSLTQSLAVEWAPKVRVNALTAGLIMTEASEGHYGDQDGIRAVADTIPLGRFGAPSEVGDACLFLASPRASYVSGASLLIHGGGEKPAFLGASNATPSP
jgi:NAD(P)-dependent dehydrogenase (short-subunit alcohol dehydrogenase family)